MEEQFDGNWLFVACPYNTKPYGTGSSDTYTRIDVYYGPWVFFKQMQNNLETRLFLSMLQYLTLSVRKVIAKIVLLLVFQIIADIITRLGIVVTNILLLISIP